MEVKKSPKADLEGKKTTGLLIGYVLILAVMFVAFEWTDRDKQVTTDTGIVGPIFEEEMIPITEQEEKTTRTGTSSRGSEGRRSSADCR